MDRREELEAFLKNYGVTYCEIFNHKNKKPFIYCDGCRRDLASEILSWLDEHYVPKEK